MQKLAKNEPNWTSFRSPLDKITKTIKNKLSFGAAKKGLYYFCSPEGAFYPFRVAFGAAKRRFTIFLFSQRGPIFL